jgi:ribose transport system ATP-binding protein
MATALSMIRISKAFPGVKALQEVSLELQSGEVHVLLGENGAGKSTLMKILAGIYQPDQGQILVDGKPVSLKSPREAQRVGISMIHQELNLVPFQSIAENILLGREPRFRRAPFLIDRGEIKKQASMLLESVGLGINPLVTVSSLSVAQQQMVAIAKALSVQAKIIVMDEPTASLTTREIEKLFLIIERLKSQGITIVYISHRLQEVHRIGDRSTVLRDGKVIGVVELARVSLEDLIRMMVGEKAAGQAQRYPVTPGRELLRIEGLPASSGVSDTAFQLRSGEIVGLAGVVGAGRTELAHAIFGIDPLKDGRMFLHGKPALIKSPKSAVSLGIGLLPEDRRRCGLFDILSFRDNVVSAAQRLLSRFGITRPSLERQVSKKFVQDLRIVTPGITKQVKFLSGGNQQKTVIAKWLCSQAQIFIFDEPTRGVDVGARREVHQLMNELTQSGAGILMISSDLPELLDMSDRMYVLNRGKIVTELNSRETTHEEVLRYATKSN